MSTGALRALSLLAASLTLGLSAASVLFIVLTPDLDLLSGYGSVGYDAVFAVVFIAVGVFITTSRPPNLVGWLFVSSGVLSAVQTATASYAGYGQ